MYSFIIFWYTLYWMCACIHDECVYLLNDLAHHFLMVLNPSLLSETMDIWAPSVIYLNWYQKNNYMHTCIGLIRSDSNVSECSFFGFLAAKNCWSASLWSCPVQSIASIVWWHHMFNLLRTSCAWQWLAQKVLYSLKWSIKNINVPATENMIL